MQEMDPTRLIHSANEQDLHILNIVVQQNGEISAFRGVGPTGRLV
jgi:hypothetical protein